MLYPVWLIRADNLLQPSPFLFQGDTTPVCLCPVVQQASEHAVAVNGTGNWLFYQRTNLYQDVTTWQVMCHLVCHNPWQLDHLSSLISSPHQQTHINTLAISPITYITVYETVDGTLRSQQLCGMQAHNDCSIQPASTPFPELLLLCFPYWYTLTQCPCSTLKHSWYKSNNSVTPTISVWIL